MPIQTIHIYKYVYIHSMYIHSHHVNIKMYNIIVYIIATRLRLMKKIDKERGVSKWGVGRGQCIWFYVCAEKIFVQIYFLKYIII